MLVRYVGNDQAVILAETLIFASLLIQVFFGTIGTYVQNRINSDKEDMKIASPDFFILLTFIAALLMTLISTQLEEVATFSIIILTITQGGFNFVNSYVGITKSIRISLLNNLFVYIIFICGLGATLFFKNNLTAWTWIFIFNLSNLLGMLFAILQINMKRSVLKDVKRLILFEKKLYQHALGTSFVFSFLGMCFFIQEPFTKNTKSFHMANF